MAVTKCLARMRTLGITVVCVIHQPRYAIFKQFTHCLLLGKGGKTVYIGKTSQVEDYFVSHGFRIPRGENVADWFIDIISGAVDHYQPDGSVDRSFQKEDLFDYWTAYQEQQKAEESQVSRPVPRFSRTVSVRSLGATNSEDSGVFQTEDELTNKLCELLDTEPDSDLTPQQMYRLARLFEIECDMSEAKELYRVLKAEQGEVTFG
ncbi:ATP-binding cassette transporter, putative [Perkinsus marinus ATCC 50983]|uniref:ATP-binding cassette transporter, putative n=1 Tax=Perkinsus marinus (strain ATCC 50983 / TXsc) TaxID=423536 RepID=C5L3A6_PERM5|nr:ATP-binding cassette transporter, putative [Perkinsus marinus ATCC 50983]EER08787.1 ATP-binding cassette transporter, putative [Perkinsus marinus ATCC 50983]|eukprot:XP_002776971.1 ATP-binding cassette transporter, putative [Perkinsus marinus ATCC 50983]